MKTGIKLIIAVFLVALALGFVKNAVAKGAVQQVCRKITGLQLKIRDLSLSLTRGVLDAKGIQLFNPRGFEDRVMVEIPELYANIDLPSVFRGRTRVEELRLNLSQLTIVKNRDGKLNLDSLKPASKKEAAKEQDPQKKEEAAKKAAPSIQIDKLVLKVGKVVYKDYSAGGQPTVQEFDVNLNETHTNITNPNALVPLLVSRAVMNTAVSQFVKLDMQSLLSDFNLSGTDLKSLGLEQFGGFLEKAGVGADGAAKDLQAVFGAFLKKDQ